MRKIMLIFGSSVMRNKVLIIVSAAATALMCFIFNGISHSETSVFADEKIGIGIVDHDNSALSEDLKRYAEASLDMEIYEESYDELSALLINKDISAIIEIPQELEASAVSGNIKTLQITTLDDYENSAFIKAYLDSYMRSVSVLSQAAQGSAEKFSDMLAAEELPHKITVAEAELQKDDMTAAAYSTTAGFVMMMMSGITVFIASQILVDRQLGTYNRMKCSSLRSSEYVIGISLFGVVCCTAANLIYNLFVFSTEDGIAVSMWLAIGANQLFLLFSVGFTVLMAMCLDSQQSLMTAGIGYTVIGCMLGGAWFPIDAELGFVGRLARFFPQYWLMDILRNSGEAGFSAAPNICILALSAVLAFLVSAVIFTRKNA